MKKDIFFEANQDILLAIESQVVSYYRQNPKLVDNNVEKIYNSLQRVFDKEVQEKNVPKLKFTPLEQDLYKQIESICRLFAGEGKMYVADSEEEKGIDDFEIDAVSKTTIIHCMKRLRSSIKTWSTFGTRGYLDYVSQFM